MEGIMSRQNRPVSVLVLLLSVFLIGAYGVWTAAEARAASRAGDQESMQTPPPARDVVAEAVRTAGAEQKGVLIEFGASWCIWCTNFQNLVHSPDAGRVMTSNFVMVNLVVREAGGKEALEHPGGAELMTEWGGAKSGLPFYVFLDAAGAKVADSNAMPDGSNIGYPVTAVEIARFMGLLDRTAPRLTPVDRATVLAYLEKTARN
jgi:thiol:disulfide interchange protein